MDKLICCPEFNPIDFDYKKIVYKDKQFVKQRVFSIFHIPLNFGSVMRSLTKKIETSLAKDPEQIMLVDENSLWGSDVLLSVTGKVKNAENTKMTGVFLTRVFEGPYRNMGKWIKEMQNYAKSQKEEIKKLYFYYVTCPKCAKKRGVNYIVIFAKV